MSDTAVVISAEVQQAIDRINAFSDKLEKLKEKTDASGTSAKNAGAGMEFFKEKLTSIAAAAGGAFTIDKILDFSKEVYAAALDMEKSNALLNNALKTTQHAAGLTREEIDGLIESLTKSTNFDDDGLKKAAASMLRFRDIQGETFARALPLAADLATAMGTDLVSASQALGRALESPGTGMRGLRAAGVALNEQQADLAEKLIKTGDYAGAQKIVLDALTKSIGGTAQGAHTGLTGASEDAKKAWDDFLKSLAATDTYKDTIGGFQKNASSRLKILTDDIKELGKWWDKYFAPGQGAKSTAQIEQEQTAAEERQRQKEQQRAGQEKRDAEEGAASQRKAQAEQKAYEEKKARDEAAQKSAEQQLAAYNHLNKAISEKIAVQQAELGSQGQVTEGGREYAKFLGLVTTGILKLNAAQIAEMAGKFDLYLRTEALAEAEKNVAKSRAENQKYYEDHLKALNDEADKLEQQVKFYGQTKSAIDADTVARLENAKAIVAQFGTPEQLAYLEAAIAAKRRAATAEAQKEFLDTNKKTADEAARDWKKFSDDIESSLTDALMRGFEGGKNAGRNFIDTLKHSLETAALKIAVQAIVSPVMSAAGSALGVTGGGASGGGSSLLSGISAASNLSGGGFLGKVAGSSLLAGTDFGAGLGFAASNGIFSGLSVAVESFSQGLIMQGIGAALPGLGAALAVGSALGLFGGGGEDPHNNPQWSGYDFILNKSGVQGSGNPWSGNTVAGPAYTVTGKTSGKGYWSEMSALSGDQIAAINKAVDAVFANGAAFARALGVDPSVIDSATVNSGIQGVSTPGAPLTFKTIDDALAALSESIAEKVIPNLKDFQATGEALATTAQRLQEEFSLTNQIARMMGKSASEVFGSGGLSARDNLISLMGGTGAASSALGSYYQNYFSGNEIASNTRGQIGATLKSLGIGSVPTTRAEFRALVEAQDLTSESGRKMYATLIAVADAFAGVTKSADDLANSFKDTQFATRQDFLYAQATGLAPAVRDSVGAKIDALILEVRAGNVAIAQNTRITAKQLTRWDGDGMPDVRVLV